MEVRRSQSQRPTLNSANTPKSRKIHGGFGGSDDVEVCLKEEGFQGSYYEAKVVQKVGRTKLLVEYKSLLSDYDGVRPLREIVEAADARPVPPAISSSCFQVLDKVDAFDNDGWWVGRITGRCEDGKYNVYFESSGDELAYPVDRLRVHQEWEDSNWFVA